MITHRDPDYLKFKENPPEVIKSKNSILTKEVKEYIESLINLEISALNIHSVSEDTLKQLNEFSFFKDLVIYNLYNKYKKLINDNDKKHLLKMINGFSIDYIDSEKTELLRFLYAEMMLCLYQIELQSLEDRIKQHEDKIRILESRKNHTQQNSIFNGNLVTSMDNQLKKLKQVTEKDLKRQYDSELEATGQRQIILSQVLKENGLVEQDFEEQKIVVDGKRYLIKKMPHASIYIQK